MRRRFALLLFTLSLLASGLHGQDAAKAELNFEVASIKATTTRPQPGEGGGIRVLPGGQTYVGRFVPLKLMIKLMYKISDSQIAGGPDWMNTDMFDVRAKAEKPSTLDDLHIMFQNMLADRFDRKS